jgi:hypothetical protein
MLSVSAVSSHSGASLSVNQLRRPLVQSSFERFVVGDADKMTRALLAGFSVSTLTGHRMFVVVER